MAKTWIATALCGLFLIGAFLVGSMAQAGWSNDEAALSRQADQLAAQIELAKNNVATTSESNTVSAAGLSQERISSDIDTAEEMVKTLVTWSNWEEYDAARNAVIKDYGVSEDSWLMTEFMAKVENADNGYGRETNIIDERGYNMQLADIDVRCIGASDDTYSYFAQATVSSGFKDQTGESKCAFTFSTDKNGKISNVDGHAVSY